MYSVISKLTHQISHAKSLRLSCSDTEHSLLVVFLHRDSSLLDLVDGKVGGSTESSDDGLRVETLLHIRLQLL